MDTIRVFFSKSGQFFRFSKKMRGGLTLNPLPICAPVISINNNNSVCFNVFFNCTFNLHLSFYFCL